MQYSYWLSLYVGKYAVGIHKVQQYNVCVIFKDMHFFYNNWFLLVMDYYITLKYTAA